MIQRPPSAGWQSGVYQTPQWKPGVSHLLFERPNLLTLGGWGAVFLQPLTAKSNTIPITLIIRNLAHKVRFDVPLWHVGTFPFGRLCS